MSSARSPACACTCIRGARTRAIKPSYLVKGRAAGARGGRWRASGRACHEVWQTLCCTIHAGTGAHCTCACACTKLLVWCWGYLRTHVYRVIERARCVKKFLYTAPRNFLLWGCRTLSWESRHGRWGRGRHGPARPGGTGRHGQQRAHQVGAHSDFGRTILSLRRR